jgi:hypothetical protein
MGAFVAVADDASAVYWNPAGLASGSYVSLVMDYTQADALPDDAPRGGERSSWLLALGTPALGLSYYRLEATSFAPGAGSTMGTSRLESLVTHHVGATVVQTIVGGLAVGGTIKLVRGIANAGITSGDAEKVLDDLPLGRSTNRFDVDAGVMYSTGQAKIGLTMRNLLRPEFETPGGEPLHLDRQARAGVALLLTSRWTAALDVDLTSNRGPLGDVRMLAIGGEGRLTQRIVARGGVEMNTAGDDGWSPAATVGGSYAVFGAFLVDAHFSAGSERAFGGWGVAGRVVF